MWGSPALDPGMAWDRPIHYELVVDVARRVDLMGGLLASSTLLVAISCM